MKTSIAVIASYLEDSCQEELITGIIQTCKKENIHATLFIGANVENYTCFNHSFTQIQHFCQSLSFDGIILLGGAIEHLVPVEDIEKWVNSYQDIPIINISTELENATNVLVDNEQAIFKIVDHLIVCHDKRKIGFITGPLEHQEARDRLKGYKKALATYHIPLDESLIIKGDFTALTAEKSLCAFLDNHPTEFDAFVCSDDVSAFGAIKALTAHGYSVPDDIAVTGFDDSSIASSSFPTLTTIKQPFEQIGIEATYLLLSRILGTPVPHNFYCNSQLILRESCGCNSLICNRFDKPNLSVSLSPKDKDLFISYIMGSIKQDCTPAMYESLFTHDTLVDWLETYLDYLSNPPNSHEAFWKSFKNHVHHLIHAGFSSYILEHIFIYIRNYCLENYNEFMSNLYVDYSFYKSLIILYEVKEQLTQSQFQHIMSYNFILRQLSEQMINAVDSHSLLQIIESGLTELEISTCIILLHNHYKTDLENLDYNHLTTFFYYENGKRIEEKQNISIPLIHFNHIISTDSFIVLPLAYNHIHLGYILFPFDLSKKLFYESLRTHINSGIRFFLLNHAREESQRIIQNTLLQLENANNALKITSFKDYLTDLYNRRGFIEHATEYFNLSKEKGLSFALFFMDLDAFKSINDTYGHQEGDEALIKVAQLLQTTFPQEAIISRLGGDEFTVLMPISSPRDVLIVTEQLERNFENHNRTSHKPYLLHFSMGYTIYNSKNHYTFDQLLSIADRNLYEHKHTKKRNLDSSCC